jgi:hypothetical protein
MQATVAYYLLLDNRLRATSGYLGAQYQEAMVHFFPLFFINLCCITLITAHDFFGLQGSYPTACLAGLIIHQTRACLHWYIYIYIYIYIYC